MDGMMYVNQSAVNRSAGGYNVTPSSTGSINGVDFTADRITTIFFISVFIPCIIAGNLLVICAVLKTRQLRTITNAFVVSLAVTDILVGSISLPIYLAFRIKGHRWLVLNYGFNLQELWQGVDIVTGVASMINLMNISIDRYICILYPFRYSTIMTAKVSAVLVIFSFLYGVFNYSMYFSGLDPTSYILMLTILAFLIPLSIIILAYINIARVAGRQAKMIKSLRKETKNTATSFLKEVKATWVLAVVVGAFILCWTGTFSLNLKFVICKECGEPTEEIINVVKMLQYFSSVVNPFIYTSLNKDFRKVIKSFIPGLGTRRASSTSAFTTSIRYTTRGSRCSEETKLHAAP